MQAEAELRRVTEEYRKLREELLPIFKIAKDRSQPLPYDPPSVNPPASSPDLYNHNVSSPPISQTSDKNSGGLARTFSKNLFLGSTPKNNSPTHIPGTIQQGKALHDSSSIDPSAAAMVASNHLTASMSGGSLPNTSPNAVPAPSPTSPAPYHGQTLASRSYARDGGASTSRNPNLNDRGDEHQPSRTSTAQHMRDREQPTSASSYSSKTNQAGNTMSTTSTLITTPHTSTTSTLIPSSSHGSTAASTSQSATTPTPQEAPSVEIFKSFRVGLEDPCYKVLPAALRKYNIQADWRQYALFIVFGDQERCVGLEEKPLSLFKMYDREGKKPMFMLRRLAVPQEGGDPAQMSAGHGGSMNSAGSTRQGPGAMNVPGGVL